MINRYFSKIEYALELIDRDDIQAVATMIHLCKGNIFVFGNGGSAATASHFAQDMNKCLNKRFICLNDNIPSILAYGNDNGFDNIFKLQLSKLITPGDLVIGISCSGNSKNVINAIEYAKKGGYSTIGITGFEGGELMRLADQGIHVPFNDMQICEDIHLIITHTILRIL